MKRTLLFLLGSIAIISCRKDQQPSQHANTYLETVRQGLEDSLLLADFKALDLSKAARSQIDSVGLYFLRVPFKDKNVQEEFVFVKTNQQGKIEKGKIVQLKGRIEDAGNSADKRKSWNGTITLASLDRKDLFESPVVNGYITALHQQPAYRTATQEPQGEVMPEIIITYVRTSGGEYSFSNWYSLQHLTLSSLDGGGGGGGSGGYYSDFSGGGGGGGSYTDPVIQVDVETQDEFEAIDIEKFIKCFTAIPDAGASCTIEIFADIPVDSDPTKIFNFTSRSPGHTFLNIHKSNGNQSATQNIGFYPKAGWKSILTSAPIDGKFVNNSQHEFNASFKLNITPAQLQAAIMEMLRSKNYKYDIDNYNCTDWALDVFNAAGGNLQIPLYDIPGNTMSVGTKTPNGVYNKLKEMKSRNDPRAPGITIGLVKGFAGNSTGPCN